MHPYFCIMFLIVLSSFLLSTRADGQDAVKHPQCSPGIETRIEWIDLVSRIIDDIQEAPFAIPLTKNLNNVQPKTSSAHRRPELLQQRLEALLSEETGKFIRSFDSLINSSVALSTMLYDVLDSTASSNSVPPLLKNIARLVAVARDDFRAKFPLPATAPGHTKRVERVSEALERLQQLAVGFARNQDIDQKAIERHLDHIKPILRDVGVLIGDVAELYPAAIEALVLNLSAVLLPEALFLRPLVILYCLGPYVLGKDAISGWLVTHVSEYLRV